MPGIVAWGFVRLSVHDCFRFSYQQDHFAVSVFRVGVWSIHDKSDHSCLSGRGQKSHKPPCRLLSLASPHLNMFAVFVLVTSDFWSRVSPASKTKARCLWDHTDGKSELLFCRCVTCRWLFWMERWNKRQKQNKETVWHRAEDLILPSAMFLSFFLSFLIVLWLVWRINFTTMFYSWCCLHMFWVWSITQQKQLCRWSNVFPNIQQSFQCLTLQKCIQ